MIFGETSRKDDSIRDCSSTLLRRFYVGLWRSDCSTLPASFVHFTVRAAFHLFETLTGFKYERYQTNQMRQRNNGDYFEGAHSYAQRNQGHLIGSSISQQADETNRDNHYVRSHRLWHEDRPTFEPDSALVRQWLSGATSPVHGDPTLLILSRADTPSMEAARQNNAVDSLRV